MNGILVTGGAGFIGSHVVDRLVGDGFAVRVLDDLSAGKPENIRRRTESGDVDFVRGSLTDADAVRKCVSGVDAVVHLAALVSVPYSFVHPDLAFAVNTQATADLLAACVDEGVERFVFVSSCAVYGHARYLPIDESHPTDPLSPYAESKLLAEDICKKMSNRSSIKTSILRLFNVYGPRQHGGKYGSVIARWMERARQKEPLTIFGDGSQSRDFVHVSDVADATVRTLKENAAAGEVFNVGSGLALTLNDLAKGVVQAAEADLAIDYDKARSGEVSHSLADISKAERLLGYRPRVTLEKGLQSLLEKPD